MYAMVTLIHSTLPLNLLREVPLVVATPDAILLTVRITILSSLIRQIDLILKELERTRAAIERKTGNPLRSPAGCGTHESWLLGHTRGEFGVSLACAFKVGPGVSANSSSLMPCSK